MLQSDPIARPDPAEETVAYGKAKTAYFDALRAAMPELENIATGKEPRGQEPRVGRTSDQSFLNGIDDNRTSLIGICLLVKKSRSESLARSAFGFGPTTTSSLTGTQSSFIST
jgi:hypothetical protein